MEEDKVYTFAEAQEIAEQLEAITVNGKKVFLWAWVTDENSSYYDVTIKNEIGSAIITLRKDFKGK